MGRGALACWQVGVAQQAYQSREHSRLLDGLDSHSSSHLLLQTYHANPCVSQYQLCGSGTTHLASYKEHRALL